MASNFMNTKDILFNSSKKMPVVRQAYIDELDWKKHLPFVDSINYKNNTFLNKNTLMDNDIPMFYEFRKKHEIFFKQPSIAVYSYAFENKIVNNSSDFLHLLFNRQGYVALEYHLGKTDDLNYSPLAFDFRYWEFQGLLNAHRFETYALSTINEQKNSDEYIKNSRLKLINIEDTLNQNYFSLYRQGNSDMSQVLKLNSPLKNNPIYKI